MRVPLSLLLVLAAPAGAAPVAGDPPKPEDQELAARIAAIDTGGSESAPRFSPDGKSVAYVARGLFVQEIGGAARKIGPITGRFRRPVFSPDARHIYFTSDKGGDEAFSLHRIALDTGTVEEITPGEKLRRDEGPFFEEGGATLLHTERPMGEAGVRLVARAAAGGGGPSTVRLTLGGDAQLLGVRADGRQALVVTVGEGLAIADLAPGAGPPRRLYPRERKEVRIHRAAAFSPDGARVFVATDDGGERTHVLALDARSGRELARHTEARAPGGDVHALVTGRGVLAYAIDLGTHHEVRVLDARTMKPGPSPTLPIGSTLVGNHPNATAGLSLSPDGKRLALPWSSPGIPQRIYLVDTATGVTTRLTTTPTPPPARIDVEVVRIPSFDGLEVPALLYRPRDAERHPVIMSIHGGFPYSSTARNDPELERWLNEGYVVLEPNVRGSAGNGAAYEEADNGLRKLEAVRDFGAVGRWIAAQPWADKDRMFVTGGSAGGYYTIMCLTHYPEMWRGGMAVVPLYDLPTAIGEMDGYLRLVFETREFVPLTEGGAIHALSPSAYISRLRAPLFVYGAANDVRTPIAQIDALVRDARARGVRVDYMRVEGAGHSRDTKSQAMLFARMHRFLREASAAPR